MNTPQAIDNFNACGFCTGDPIYLGTRRSEDAGDAPTSFPMEVYSVAGTYLGVANNKQEFITLWNSDSDDKNVGTLVDMVGPFTYQLIPGNASGIVDHVTGIDGQVIFEWDGPPDRVFNPVFGEGPSGNVTLYWGDGISDTQDFGVGFEHNYAPSRKYTVRLFTGGLPITVFDVSNSALTHLKIIKMPDTVVDYLVNGNGLTNLDLSNIPDSVTTIDGSDNALTSWDAAKLPASLQALILGTNQLSTFDSSHLPATVNDIDVSDNLITSPDIDGLLGKLSLNGLSGGTAVMNGQSPIAPPSTEGISFLDVLEERGWDVTYDSTA